VYRAENWLDVGTPMGDGFEDGGRGGIREVIVVDKLKDAELR
jgi:hypothetical protein